MKKQEVCLNSKLGEISEEIKPTFPDSRHNSIGNSKLQKTLEANWNTVELGKISTTVGGFAFKSKDFNDNGKYQIIRIGNVQPGNLRLDKSPVFIDTVETKIIEKYLLKQGDVVITLTGTRKKRDYGFTALINKENLLLNQRVAFLRFNNTCLPKFFLYYSWTESFKNQFFASETGNVGQGNVGMKAIESTTIPLPFIEEQRAIVSKIEQLFSELDNGIANLKLAQEQLKVYRQAVLKKAFEGELTKKWREQQTDLSGAGGLLEQISKEKEKAAKLSGKRLKQVKPFTEDELEDLNRLPKEWNWVKIGDLTLGVEYGTSAKSKESGDVAVLRMGNIQNGRFDWSDLVYTSDKTEIEKYLLRKDDVLFNRTNSPELVGKTAIYKGERPAIFAGYLIRINQLPELVVADYLNYFLNCHIAKVHGNSIKTDGVNQSNINGEKLGNYPFPLCSLPEQHVIVQEIETRLSVCDKIEQDIEMNLEKAEALRQSILKKAFEGKLLNERELAEVRGAEDWEPAEVLLKKIKAEKMRK